MATWWQRFSHPAPAMPLRLLALGWNRAGSGGRGTTPSLSRPQRQPSSLVRNARLSLEPIFHWQ